MNATYLKCNLSAESYERFFTLTYCQNRLIKCVRKTLNLCCVDIFPIDLATKHKIKAVESELSSVTILLELCLLNYRMHTCINSLKKAKDEAGDLLEEYKSQGTISHKKIGGIMAHSARGVGHIATIISVTICKPISFVENYMELGETAKKIGSQAKIFHFISQSTKLFVISGELIQGKNVLIRSIQLIFGLLILSIGIVTYLNLIGPTTLVVLSFLNAGIGLHKAWRKASKDI